MGTLAPVRNPVTRVEAGGERTGGSAWAGFNFNIEMSRMLGLYWGLYGDNEKETGNYYLGLRVDSE